MGLLPLLGPALPGAMLSICWMPAWMLAISPSYVKPSLIQYFSSEILET